MKTITLPPKINNVSNYMVGVNYQLSQDGTETFTYSICYKKNEQIYFQDIKSITNKEVTANTSPTTGYIDLLHKTYGCPVIVEEDKFGYSIVVWVHPIEYSKWFKENYLKSCTQSCDGGNDILSAGS